MTLLNGSLDFYSRSSPLEHGGLLLLASDDHHPVGDEGVLLSAPIAATNYKLVFDGGGEELFPNTA